MGDTKHVLELSKLCMSWKAITGEQALRDHAIALHGPYVNYQSEASRDVQMFLNSGIQIVVIDLATLLMFVENCSYYMG